MQHQKYVLGSQEKFNGGGGTVKITSAPGPTCRKIFINNFAIAMLFSHADLVHGLNIHNWAGWQDLNI